MLSANDTTAVSKRTHSSGGSIATPEPKRQRACPEPVYIDLVSSDDEDPATTGETNPHHRTLPSSGSDMAGHPPENAEPIEATVDRLVAEYSQGIPLQIYGKKAKYYVVWHGRQCGIFMTWADCERQVTGFKSAGFKGTKTYEDAVSLLRENLIGKLREQAREEQHARPPPQPPTAAPGTAAIEGTTHKKPEPIASPEEPALCQEQQDAMDLAIQGHNLFITGSGGCGKSVLVKALHKTLRNMGKTVHLLAPTGQAALNIGGRTTFSYAGWVPDDRKRTLEDLVKKSRGKRIFTRFCRTDVLIIDEISMVENQFLDRLSRVMSIIRYGETDDIDTMEVGCAFGGVQVIAVGDFCQLPPVKPFQNCAICGSDMEQERSGNAIFSYSCPMGHGSFQDHDKWAFKSLEWKRCEFKCVNLKKIHRQQDEEFVRILQKCRLGEDLDQRDNDLLLKHPAQVENGARLFSHREQVNNLNAIKFAQLPGKSLGYCCLDSFKPTDYGDYWKTFDEDSRGGSTDQALRPEEALMLLNEHRYSRLVNLKVHMPVILLANIDLENGLCNGSQGTICGFVPVTHLPGPEMPQEKNYRDPDGFRVAMERYSQVQAFKGAKGTPDLFPDVRFHNGKRRVIGPNCTVNEIGTNHPYSLLSRTQIPLAPGWAMTIHKSQSLSLDRVIVNLGSVFEKGQAYVALSRARSLQGLKIEGANEATLKSGLQLDAEVRKFLEQLNAAGAGTA